MHVIHVDVITLQTAEAGLKGLHNVVPRGATVVRASPHGEPAFGRHHKAVPAALQRLPEGFLTAASHVGVRGVNEVDPHIQGRVENTVDLSRGQAVRAKAIRAQAYHRHSHTSAAELTIFHSSSPRIGKRAPCHHATAR